MSEVRSICKALKSSLIDLQNAVELLGLSPRYLFSLQCFSQTLSQQEADHLFDNISYLSDSALTPEEQAENLHVFTLTGWGEPGSATPDEQTGDPQRRRQWSCWCAAHRPESSPPVDPANAAAARDRNLVILEFELERDIFNPLYPPTSMDTDSPASGISSPSDGSGSTSEGSGGGVTSDSSDRTLVSNASGTDENRHASDGSGDTSHASVTANSLATSSSPNPTNQSRRGNADEWLPSPEDILESTTSRSKPLLALERLRRSKRPAEEPGSPSPGDPSTRPSARGTKAPHLRG